MFAVYVSYLAEARAVEKNAVKAHFKYTCILFC